MTVFWRISSDVIESYKSNRVSDLHSEEHKVASPLQKSTHPQTNQPYPLTIKSPKLYDVI